MFIFFADLVIPIHGRVIYVETNNPIGDIGDETAIGFLQQFLNDVVPSEDEDKERTFLFTIGTRF